MVIFKHVLALQSDADQALILTLYLEIGKAVQKSQITLKLKRLNEQQKEG